MVTAFTLGNITIQDFEVPEEFDKFGGYQSMVIHQFAGGVRTVQTFGDFSPEKIKWKAHFFAPSTAQFNANNAAGAAIQQMNQRIALFEQMRKAAQIQTLTFGIYSYAVLIEEFYHFPRIEYWVPYEITLVPIADYTSWAGGTNSGSPGGSALFSNNGPTGGAAPTSVSPFPSPASSPFPASSSPGVPSAPSSSNPGSTDPFQTLQNETSIFNNQLANPPATLAPGVQQAAVPALTTFQQSLNTALQQSLTIQSLRQNATLQQQLATAQQAIGGLINSTDPSTAAFANPVNSTLSVIGQSMQAGTNLIKYLPGITNPNFLKLAQQYYGNADNWLNIANFNNIFLQQPTGTFNIRIPALNN